MSTRFEFINRGYKDTIVLLPGWGTDHRIFGRLDMPFNYLVPLKIELDDIYYALSVAMAGKEAVLMGWSFGALLAAHFLVKFPNVVKKTVLVGVKEAYATSEIGKMKNYLDRSPVTYMKGFYRRCLSFQGREDRAWFSSYLQEGYLRGIDQKYLKSQLDYMEFNPLPLNELQKYSNKISVIHGEKDLVIPLEEAHSLVRKLRGASFNIIKNTGHACFMDRSFKELISERAI